MADDFSALENMIYSGRGITMGMTPSGNSFIGYSLTGRSPPSQARTLEKGEDPVTGETTNTIRTHVTNEEELKKGSPALLLYPALTHFNGVLIASNGAQTNLIYSQVANKSLSSNGNHFSLKKVMEDSFKHPNYMYDQKNDKWIDITNYEPDAPNNTPRVNGILRGNEGIFYIVSKGEDGTPNHNLYEVKFKPGEAQLITTYEGGNQKPLEPFVSEPLDVKIESNMATLISTNIYDAIQGGKRLEIIIVYLAQLL